MRSNIMKYQSLLFASVLLGLTQVCLGQDADLPLSQAGQQAFTPDQVLEALLAGNERFAAGEATQRDITARIAASAQGQYPKAVILSCLDSRVPVEKVFDVSIGDIFVGRVAGNIVNEDQLGSMEFATKLAGAKLVMVLGHSQCGAVKGAIDGAELGNLTALLAKIRPAVDGVEGFSPDQRTSSNDDFVEQVIDQNVHDMVAQVREQSSVLANLEQSGQIKIVGASYDLNTGKVELID
ncbi:carbonic anhydrase [Allochromatium palmeri]|uniref:Carbonic anhydrase n=2 Tax=Allochromatium palmeri TaxID=231048 RepID=A0A6N8EHJ2_9GAMM|nr:carbonic anhydrase family protein [Allochromatium palmeri]MTW21784.1 carbonic anhydrase [Allochromatium palmeri]